MHAMLVRASGTEDDLINEAQVLPPGQMHNREAKRFVSKLSRLRHGTPFETIFLVWYIELPLFVMAQWHRHRIAWSYSVASMRYKEAKPHTWFPGGTRKLKEIENFNPMAPELLEDVDLARTVQQEIRDNFADSYKRYQRIRVAGVACEVARTVLPTSTYTAMYARCTMRSFLNFASLRLKGGKFESHPQWEIENLCLQMCYQLDKKFPNILTAFMEGGNVAP